MVKGYAKAVLSAHWDGTLPVNVDTIAKKLGIELVGLDDIEHSGKYADGKIIFNKSHTFKQRQFCIAHLIGHHVLRHKDCPEESSVTMSRLSADIDEHAANQFALSLLMPSDHLRYAILNEGKTNLKELSDIFGVSTVALHERLKKVMRMPELSP